MLFSNCRPHVRLLFILSDQDTDSKSDAGCRDLARSLLALSPRSMTNICEVLKILFQQRDRRRCTTP